MRGVLGYAVDAVPSNPRRRSLARALLACASALSGSLALPSFARADVPPITRYTPGPSSVTRPPAQESEATSDDDLAREQHLSDAGGFEVELGTGMFRPPIAGATFHGSGVPAVEGVAGIQRVSFVANGRDFGMYAPTGYGGSLSVRYLRRYLAVGLLFGAAGDFHADGPVADERIVATAAPSGLYWLTGAFDLEGTLPVKPVTFRGGVLLGAGSATVSLDGFAPTTCHSSKRGDFPCVEHATATVIYVQPRVGFDVALGNADTSNFALGGYVGWNVIPQRSLELGVTIAFRTPQWTLMP